MSNYSQASPAAAPRQQTWQSWRLFWYSLFYVSMFIAAGLALTIEAASWWKLSLIVVGSLLLGTWYVAFLMIPVLAFRRHSWRALGYLSTGWVLWFALLLLNPAYFLVLFGLYPQVFILLSFPWSILGGAVLLLLSLWAQLLLLGNGDWVRFFFTLGTGVIGICFTLFLEATFSRTSKQADLIEQLQTAHRELAQAERLAGIMQERQRLAADIHDTVAQRFASIVLSLESVSPSLRTHDARTSTALERIERTAREGLAEIRALLWALQPEVFERTSLPEFLEALAVRWSEEQGITARTVITGKALPLRPEIEVTLLRAAQEALANVWKHAQARSVVLTLSYVDEMVFLDVQDDGKGFDPSRVLAVARAKSTEGFGLLALCERAQQQGGTLTIESEPEKGTTVALTLPALPAGLQQAIQEEQR